MPNIVSFTVPVKSPQTYCLNTKLFKNPVPLALYCIILVGQQFTKLFYNVDIWNNMFHIIISPLRVAYFLCLKTLSFHFHFTNNSFL